MCRISCAWCLIVGVVLSECSLHGFFICLFLHKSAFRSWKISVQSLVNDSLMTVMESSCKTITLKNNSFDAKNF